MFSAAGGIHWDPMFSAAGGIRWDPLLSAAGGIRWDPLLSRQFDKNQTGKAYKITQICYQILSLKVAIRAPFWKQMGAPGTPFGLHLGSI